MIFLATFISLFVVSLVSLVGILTLVLHRTTLQKFLLLFVSFAAGALFGDSFFHLLPEAASYGFTLPLSLSLFLGVFFFFILENIISWHHCHSPHHSGHVRRLAWMNLVGDGLHNFIDGFIIAASYLASIPLGIATTIAVILHEIPQEIGDFGVLLHGGFSVHKALLFNLLTAALAFVGAGVGLLFSQIFSLELLLAFSAGSFLYIAGSDLIPELHKNIDTQRALLQIIALLLGVSAMLLLLLMG